MATRINIPTRFSHIRRAIQSAFGLIMRVAIFLLISLPTAAGLRFFEAWVRRVLGMTK